MYTCIYICIIRVYMCIHRCVYMYICTCLNTHTYVYIYTYIYIHIHIHIDDIISRGGCIKSGHTVKRTVPGESCMAESGF